MRVKMKAVLFGEIGKIINAYLATYGMPLLKAFHQKFFRFGFGAELLSDHRDTQRFTGSFKDKARLGAKCDSRSVIYFQQWNINKEEPGSDTKYHRLCHASDANCF